MLGNFNNKAILGKYEKSMLNSGADSKMIVLWYVYPKALNIINNCILLAVVNIPNKGYFEEVL